MKSKTLEERKEAFYLWAGTDLLTEPDLDMVKEFVNYWTEPNPKQTKMRFEGEKYFDMKRRFGTWKRNAEKFNPKKDFQTHAIKVLTQRENDLKLFEQQNGNSNPQLGINK